ncbi:MAG TPA: hypothetical protein VJ868_02870 [Actinomycetota bacterium]|nr:hypothetical protein [Actinomycetota bacterium]
MTDVWPGSPRASRRARLLGAGTALAGAVVSGAALFLPWDRSCADLGRFAPGPVCSSAPGLRAGGVLAVALVVGAVAVALVIPTLRGAALPWAAVAGLGVASATVALGAIEALGGSAWGVWPWIAGGGIQAGAHIWTLIRAGPSAS